MANATTRASDHSLELALQRGDSEQSPHAWIAVILFVLSAAAVAGSFYLSYRDLPVRSAPATNAPAAVDPYQ